MCRESAALLGACGVDLADIRFFEENAVTVLVVSQRKALAVVTQSGASLDELVDGDVQMLGHRCDVRVGELDLPRPLAAVAAARANVNVALFCHLMALWTFFRAGSAVPRLCTANPDHYRTAANSV